MPHITSYRRGAAAVAALMIGSLALAGCADQDDDASAETADEGSSGESAGESLLPEAEGNTEYPLTLETVNGETVLEERPERIAAITPIGRDVELLAALGATPVIAPDSAERGVWTMDAVPGEIEEVFEIEHTGETPHEQVAAAEPDLIIAFGKDLADEWDELSSIAPIVGINDESAVMESAWETEIQLIGEALDLSDSADQVIADHEEFFEEVRADNPEFDGLTATYLVQYGPEYGTTYFSTPGSDAEGFLTDIGFSPNPLAEEFADDDTVSPEMVSEVDGDVLLVASTSGDEEEVEELLTGSELFQQLDAVESDSWVSTYGTPTGYIYEGTEYEGNVAWALSRGGPLGMQWAAERLVPIFQDAVQ